MTSAPAIREVRVGAQTGIELSSADIAIVVLPGFGGRVVSLVDRRNRREWLVQGLLPSHDVTLAGSAFDPAVAWGWDECLPTVTPCPDPRLAGGVLRDHGVVWGRPTKACPDGDSLRLTVDVDDPASSDGWSFSRTLTIVDRSVGVDYAIENRGRDALSVLWSMHPLLALAPDSTLHLPGVTDALATFASGQDIEGMLPGGRPARVGWPTALVSGAIRRLDVVPGQEVREAIKLYAGPLARGTAAVSAPDGSWLGYRWDVATAPFLGVWISNGGWPAPETGVFQYALEPTTAAADSLEAAIAGDGTLVVMPGERRTWWVTLELGSSRDTLADYLAAGADDSNPPGARRGLE